MGKLHTLKRAILRKPEKWYHAVNYGGKIRVSFMGATFDKGQWRPAKYYENCMSYRNFVKSVLIKNDLVAPSDTE